MNVEIEALFLRFLTDLKLKDSIFNETSEKSKLIADTFIILDKYCSSNVEKPLPSTLSTVDNHDQELPKSFIISRNDSEDENVLLLASKVLSQLEDSFHEGIEKASHRNTASFCWYLQIFSAFLDCKKLHLSKHTEGNYRHQSKTHERRKLFLAIFRRLDLSTLMYPVPLYLHRWSQELINTLEKRYFAENITSQEKVQIVEVEDDEEFDRNERKKRRKLAKTSNFYLENQKLKNASLSNCNKTKKESKTLSKELASFDENRKRIQRISQNALSLLRFRDDFMNKSEPVIITDTLSHWEALHKWVIQRSNTTDSSFNESSNNFFSLMHGHRTIPVEIANKIGETYLDSGYQHQFMTFEEFIDNYILKVNQTQRAYLAQHTLFDQIPSLMEDIIVPDYTIMSSKSGSTEETVEGERNNCKDDQNSRQTGKKNLSEAPVFIQAWIGPANTVSPLHYDNYQNLFCQIQGTKRITLFPPNVSYALNPYEGIRKNNSQINILNPPPFPTKLDSDLERTTQVKSSEKNEHYHCNTNDKVRKHEDGDTDNISILYHSVALPSSRTVTINAGEMLYIPKGYWHHVQSLTTSISISFWWEKEDNM